jgi:competence protein ComEC
MLTGGRDASAPAPWTWPAASAWQHATWTREPWLVVTVLDVGQGDATVVRFPSGVTWLVDAGGSISESFDVGQRVTTPALWALGHRDLARLVVTHAHPDHANGVPAVLRRFRPRELLTGIPVHEDAASASLSRAAAQAGVAERRLAAGETFADGAVHVRVLHPERPDWERRRVRNDDSVVLWLRMGDVAVLLPGDVGQAVEERWANRVAAAPLTVLRLAHHGSASSTSPVLVDALRPVLAVASAGRGNRFGHPSAAVMRRVHDSGAVLLRTDQDGAVQLATNGRVLLVRTARGRSGGLSASTLRHAWWPATPLPSARASPLRASARHRPGGTPHRGSGG